MKKPISKFLALLLTVVLVLSLLPAVSASEDELRDAVVSQTQSIMDVLWTKQKRNARASADFEAMQAGGVRPTIYYESDDLLVPFKGVAVSWKSGTLESFVAEINASGEEARLIKGIPNLVLDNYNDYVGMDMHSFLTDVVSRVSADAPTNVKEALNHKAMVSLAGAVNASAADSKSAADPAAVKAAYSKLKKGDILIAWNDNADVGIASNTDSPTQIDYPKLSVLVVKEVSGENVTVMYAGYHQPVWHFICDKCGQASTELTYRFPRAHSWFNSYDTWKGFTTHNDTYTDSNCKGTWEGQYATTWRTETVTFDQLIGGPAGSNVPYGSDSTYLPYTLAVYAGGAAKADVKATNATPATDISGGFKVTVSSNYRIAGFEAVLTGADGSVKRFSSAAPDYKSWTVEYSDPALDLALMDAKLGKYKLELFAKTGCADAKGNTPLVSAYTMDFNLEAASFQFSTDKTAVPQGDTVTAKITAKKAGAAVIKTAVAFDPDCFEFDEARSKAASPNVTFATEFGGTTANPTGQVNVRYSGKAVAANATPVTLYFNAKRTGLYPVTEGVDPFKMLFLQTSATEGAADAQLVSDRAEGMGQIVVGFNTVLYKNYAAGNDLVLAYVSNAYEDLVKKTTLPMMYDGVLMEEVTQARYTVDGSRYLVCFGHIGPDLDPMLITKNEASDAEMSPELEYNEFNTGLFHDVNQSGVVDVADAQTIMNIADGTLPLEGNVTKWYLADIDRNGQVNAADRDALMSYLMNK